MNINLDPTRASGIHATPVRFIEDKPSDWLRVEELLRQSASAGRSTNFGPVQDLFAEVAGRMLRLIQRVRWYPRPRPPPHCSRWPAFMPRKPVRLLVWAVSAFGFYSTTIGPLAGRVRVVDCDETGMIDISALSALPTESWDGLLVTDLFGGRPDFSQFSKLCAAAGKPMIIDAAVSFPAHRSPPLRASEIVSFHHTKPWGFGEGGCAIVDAAQAEKVRAFLNFGVGAQPSMANFAGNGKMSDIAAALILQRLEDMRAGQKVIDASASGSRIWRCPRGWRYS